MKKTLILFRNAPAKGHEKFEKVNFQDCCAGNLYGFCALKTTNFGLLKTRKSQARNQKFAMGRLFRGLRAEPPAAGGDTGRGAELLLAQVVYVGGS